MLEYLALAFLVGALIASIGWHRERKFEAFSLKAWFRSFVIAGIVGLIALTFPLPWWLYFIGLVIAGERGVCEFYKTYIKADYKPHVVCAVCHVNIHKVHGKYLRPVNEPTRSRIRKEDYTCQKKLKKTMV